ncbi:MAG: nucleotidyltransferase domain-containing protein [Tissierellales bacterium]|nr:nucleotidyltransferase domain-containing protein [Tissierellales bacterium]
MISDKVKNRILESITNIETEENVRIFYACESGSRAWGFPSTDSDYDVRFLYIHPTEWYLSIDDQKDVIEKPISNELDISGWEIKKALKLFRKSNPPLLEWLQSPIIYSEKYDVTQRLRELLPEFYSPISCWYHYLHMAQGNFKEYLKGEKVWTKKYFYILRPILACLWIENDLGPLPMKFKDLVDRIVESGELKNEIEILLERKKRGEELSWGSKNIIIDNFISNEISRLESNNFKGKKRRFDGSKLHELFRKALIKVWN